MEKRTSLIENEKFVFTASIVVPLVLGAVLKMLNWSADYYLPTIVIAWVALLLNLKLDFYKIRAEQDKDRKTYQATLNRITGEASKNYRYLSLLTRHGVVVEAKSEEEMSRLWIEACETIDGNYVATNYIKPDVQFGPFGEAALSMQRARRLCNEGKVKIRKLFIHDDDAEIETWITEEDTNPKHDFVTELRHISVDALAKGLKSRDFAGIEDPDKIREKVRDMDFAVFNEQFVLKWSLSRDRTILGGTLNWNDQTTADCLSLFERMWTVAKNHHELSKAIHKKIPKSPRSSGR